MSAGFSTLMQYLSPIRDCFTDATVNEIRINDNGTVWVEQSGRTHRYGEVVLAGKLVEFAANAIAGKVDRPFDAKHPELNTRLPDGSRVAIVGPPVAPGVVITIRRFPTPYSLDDLILTGSLPQHYADAIRYARDVLRLNVLISGGTRTGKTTLLRSIINEIPLGERLVLIEKPSEIRLDNDQQRDIVRLEVTDGAPGERPFTAREAVAHTLRQSPDRIIMGEIRGGEAFDLLDAMNTGHSGTWCTLHANDIPSALRRLATLVKRSNVDLPYDVINRDIGEAIGMIIHLVWKDGARRVADLSMVDGYDAATGGFWLRGVDTSNCLH